VHDTLDPAESAQVIAAHVTDAIKLAEKNRLPMPDPRHDPPAPRHADHQLLLLSRLPSGPAIRVDAALFTYPGPRAAVTRRRRSDGCRTRPKRPRRAARDHSREAIEQLVERIIRQRLEEGQFDDCNLTLRDLTRIKQSFRDAAHRHLSPTHPVSAERVQAPAW